MQSMCIPWEYSCLGNSFFYLSKYVIYVTVYVSCLFNYTKERDILLGGVQYTSYSCEGILITLNFIYKYFLFYHLSERCVFIIKKWENMDVCACRYKIDDFEIGDLLDILTKKTLKLIKISGNRFPTL